MTCRRFLSAAASAALLIAGLGLSAVPAAADNKPSARPEVGKPVQAAQELLKAGKAKEALAAVAPADAVSGKSPYETFIVEYIKLSAYAKLGDANNAIHAAEALVASGEATPEQNVAFLEVIASSEFNLKDCAKGKDASLRYYKAGGTNSSFRKNIVACELQANDFASAEKDYKPILQAEAKPSEDDLKLMMQIEYKVNPTGQGYFDSLKALTAAFPSKAYWHDLILFATKRPSYSDKLELDTDLLKIGTKTLDQADEYMNAAEIALQGGFPGLAKNIMDDGFAQGVLGQGAGAARQKKLQDTAAAQATTDKPQLPGQEGQLHNSSQWLHQGDAYASYGQYDQATAAYQKAIQGNSFKAPLEASQAKLHLLVAYIDAGQKAKAKDLLKQFTAQDGSAADLAQLWAIQAAL